MIRVHVTGRYGHLQPLAYAPLRALVADRVALSADAGDADLILIAHPKDLVSHGADIRASLAPHQRLVLLCEEPFWDTIWGGDPFQRDQIHDTPHGPLPYTWVNQLTSEIFDFDTIPYFLLTDRSYFNRYNLRFARGAALGTAGWQAHFDSLHDIVFMAEKRLNEKFDRRCPGPSEVFGMSALRTRIALACAGDHVRRIGHGWAGTVQRRALPDWHMDKLWQLDGRTRVLSAIENTHARPYITEKLFDAFAVGAWPLYVAGPGHRVHDLVPAGSWLNLYGLTPADAADAIANLRPDPGAYAAAQAHLARTLSIANLAAEHQRLRSALLAEFSAVMEAPAQEV